MMPDTLLGKKEEGVEIKIPTHELSHVEGELAILFSYGPTPEGAFISFFPKKKKAFLSAYR